MLICPQALLREGLHLLLSQYEDLEIVQTAVNTWEVLDAPLRQRPDVIMVACSRDNSHCDAAVRHLQDTWPKLPVLVISTDTAPGHVQQTLAGGATGYLPLDVEVDQLLWALNNVTKGELTLHPQLMRALASHLAAEEASDTQPDFEDLSPREQEVLAQVVQGQSDRDIAQVLFISVRTVQAHLAHIYDKLGVHSRTEAAVIAVRAGWFARAQEEVGNQ